MSEPNKDWVSVAAIANMGFGFLLFLDGFIYTGIVSLANALGLLVFSLFFIVGLGYLIAGIIELKLGAGNTGYVILAYSLFGFILSATFLLSYGLHLFYPPTPTVLLAFWIFWIFVSIISGVILRPLGRMIEINLYWLAITFAFFAAAGYGNLLISLIAGILAFVQAFYNWYIVSAIVVNTTFKKLIIPMK